MTKINPKTNELAAALTTELADVINRQSVLYTRPENAAVVPEALVTLLAVTIGTNYERSGHATLISLVVEKLTELVDDAYNMRALFNAIDRAMDDAEAALDADDDADPAAALSPETKAQIDALMASLSGEAKH